MIRTLDFTISLLGLITFAAFFLIISFIVFLETGAPLFRQERLGLKKERFTLWKFRTLKTSTKNMPTHLLKPNAVTISGSFLRKVKIDELPQLWNVLKGEMSLVGPRPCLPDQDELIVAREKRGIFLVKPGLTGLAQIRGIDMSQPEFLAKTEAEMLADFSVSKYFSYILLTVLGKGAGDFIKK